MANRETYPSAQSPLQGDLSAPPGNTTVKVIGLQGNPVSPATPNDLANLTWNSDDLQWEPIVPSYTIAFEDATGHRTILSDDWEIYVNGVELESLVSWPYGFAFQVFINGVGVPGSEQ